MTLAMTPADYSAPGMSGGSMSGGSMSGDAPAPPERASLADWLAVIAGTIGALMALMDISIVNASLPVIQGEIGATPSEGTWVGTAYLMAEITVIPLTAWLERMLGLRWMLVGGAILFTAFSVMCGLSSSLAMMIVGRLGQGLTGAVMIPTGFTIVAKRLPPAQQAQGLALVAMAALLGPAIGPVLGGWLTENVSWHYAFFINVPICALMVVLLFVGIEAAPRDWRELREADWIGIVGMGLGLGGLTTFLELGQRERWFDSPLIWRVAGLSLIGFVMIAFSQARSRHPVIKLRLLRHNATLASAAMLLLVIGMLIYGTLYLTPQFLAAVAGYNALQAGQVCFISGICAVPTAMVYPLLISRIDVRAIIGSGVTSCGVACFLTCNLTPLDTGGSFVLAQVLLGVGLVLTTLPLTQLALASVSVDDSGEANAIMSVTRNIGGSIGLSAIASFQEARLSFHEGRIASSLQANGGDVQGWLAQNSALLGGGPDGTAAAMRIIDGQVSLQALVMTFNDLFLAAAVITALTVPLVLFLKPMEPGAAPVMGH